MSIGFFIPGAILCLKFNYSDLTSMKPPLPPWFLFFIEKIFKNGKHTVKMRMYSPGSNPPPTVCTCMLSSWHSPPPTFVRTLWMAPKPNFSCFTLFFTFETWIIFASKKIDDKDGPRLQLWSSNKIYILLDFHFLIIIFILSYWYDQKTVTMFTGSCIFTQSQIWEHPNWCAQNKCTNVENSLDQHHARTTIWGQYTSQECQVTLKSKEKDAWKRYLQYVKY